LFSTYKKLEMVLKDGLEPSRSKATDFLNLTLLAANFETGDIKLETANLVGNLD